MNSAERYAQTRERRQRQDAIPFTIAVRPASRPIVFNPRCRICGLTNRRDPRHRAHIRRAS